MANTYRITVDGKEYKCSALEIVPWLSFNPAAALSTDLVVLSTCRFDVRGRAEGDDVFSFHGLETADKANWPRRASALRPRLPVENRARR